jgi:hypothetical protein
MNYRNFIFATSEVWIFIIIQLQEVLTGYDHLTQFVLGTRPQTCLAEAQQGSADGSL